MFLCVVGKAKVARVDLGWRESAPQPLKFLTLRPRRERGRTLSLFHHFTLNNLA